MSNKLYQGLALVGSRVQGPVLRLLDISVRLDISVHQGISLQEPVLIKTSRVISLIDSTVVVTVSTIAYNNNYNSL